MAANWSFLFVKKGKTFVPIKSLNWDSLRNTAGSGRKIFFVLLHGNQNGTSIMNLS